MTFLKLTSTLVGQHSTARLSMILASSGSSSSTAAFHKRTEFGTCSRAGEAKTAMQIRRKKFTKEKCSFQRQYVKDFGPLQINSLQEKRERTVILLTLVSTRGTESERIKKVN